MLKKSLIVLSLVSIGALPGCGTIRGEYACGVPSGVICKSLKEVYADTNGRLPPPEKPPVENKTTGGRNEDAAKEQAGAYKATLLTSQIVNLPKIEPGQPLRMEPRVLRIWYAPWEDEERVFHDQSFAYVVVDDGRWLLSQNRNQVEMTWRSRMVIPPVKGMPVSEDKEEKKTMTAPAAPASPNAAVQSTFDSADKTMGK